MSKVQKWGHAILKSQFCLEVLHDQPSLKLFSEQKTFIALICFDCPRFFVKKIKSSFHYFKAEVRKIFKVCIKSVWQIGMLFFLFLVSIKAKCTSFPGAK